MPDLAHLSEVVPLREMKVARLAHGLHRVLFTYVYLDIISLLSGSTLTSGHRPGVHPFRDLRSGVWNFPANFVSIPTPDEFAFDRSPKYVTPSQDEVGFGCPSLSAWRDGTTDAIQELLSLAKREDCRFVGSTSTLTQAFSHIYFAISGA